MLLVAMSHGIIEDEIDRLKAITKEKSTALD